MMFSGLPKWLHRTDQSFLDDLAVNSKRRQEKIRELGLKRLHYLQSSIGSALFCASFLIVSGSAILIGWIRFALDFSFLSIFLGIGTCALAPSIFLALFYWIEFRAVDFQIKTLILSDRIEAK